MMDPQLDHKITRNNNDDPNNGNDSASDGSSGGRAHPIALGLEILVEGAVASAPSRRKRKSDDISSEPLSSNETFNTSIESSSSISAKQYTRRKSYCSKEEGCDEARCVRGRCRKHARLHNENEKQLIALLLNEATTVLKEEETSSSAIKNGKQGKARPRKYCKAEGCDKWPHGRGGLCIRHGGGTLCAEEGCTKGAKGGGRCIAHGGGNHCKEEGCTKHAQVKGRCRKHAREHKRVSAPRCKEEGCEKQAQSGMEGRCIRHGRLHVEKEEDTLNQVLCTRL